MEYLYRRAEALQAPSRVGTDHRVRQNLEAGKVDGPGEWEVSRQRPSPDFISAKLSKLDTIDRSSQQSRSTSRGTTSSTMLA